MSLIKLLQRSYTVVIIWHKESDLNVCHKDSQFCIPYQPFPKSQPLVHTNILYGHKWSLCTELWVENSIRNPLINNLPSSFLTSRVRKILKWENKGIGRERERGEKKGRLLGREGLTNTETTKIHWKLLFAIFIHYYQNHLQDLSCWNSGKQHILGWDLCLVCCSSSLCGRACWCA